MTFITGGTYQGKTEFAVKHFRFSKNEIADGSDKFEMLLSAKCICNFENFIFNVVEKDCDPISEISTLLSQNPDVVIIMNEVGSGIIPIERTERKKREVAGRTGCMLAEKSKTTIRVICGIPTVLKGELQ